MELRHLRVLIAVADELHFGRAGDRLNLTQPAVSAQIRQLERELDARLLHRSARCVALTEAGQMFLADARRIVKQADAASSSVRAWREGNGARLRIGYVDDALPLVLPVALRRLAATTDPPSVQLTTGEPGNLIAQVKDESLDVALVALPSPVGRLRVLPFAEEHAAVAVRARMFDGHEDDVPIEIVARDVVLTPPRRMNPGFHDAVVAAFSAAGLQSPLLEVEDASLEQLLLLVAAGAGMALVAESVIDRTRLPGVVFRRLTPREAVRCPLAAISTDSSQTPQVRRFLAALASPVAARGEPKHLRGARGDRHEASLDNGRRVRGSARGYGARP